MQTIRLYRLKKARFHYLGTAQAKTCTEAKLAMCKALKIPYKDMKAFKA